MSTDNIVLPAGKIYFRPMNSEGNFTNGYRWLGNCPGLTINVTTESVQHYTSYNVVKELDEDVTTTVTRGGGIVIDNITPENLAFAMIGEVVEITQSSGTVSSEAISGVNQGRYYIIGEGVDSETGAKNISNVSVTGDGGSPSYTVDDDYTVDENTGLLYIVEGGGISDDTDIEVTYDTAAETYKQVKTTGDGKLRGALLYISNNRTGEEADYKLPNVEIRPDGDLALLSDDDSFMTINGSLAVKTDSNDVAIYADDRPVATA
jgi:hypothetical protein